MTIALQSWHTETGPMHVGGSLLLAPPALRSRAVELLVDAGHRLHLDVVIGADGHRGLTWDEVERAARQAAGQPVDLHLVLLDGIAPSDEEERLFDTARDVGAAVVGVSRATLERHPAAAARLRQEGVDVWLELQPGDPEPDEREASLVDGVGVMLIAYGAKNPPGTDRVDDVRRLAARLPVAVEGGVTPELARHCLAAGAEHVVAGRSLFAVGHPHAEDVDTEPSPEHQRATAWQEVADEVACTLDAVDPASFERAARFAGRQDGRWFFTGQGRSGLVARMAAMRFTHLGRETHVVGEATAPAIGAGDHLVAISSSGTSTVTRHLAGVARAAGADLMVVTASPDSPLAAGADAVLVVPAPGTRQFAGSLFEQSALLLLDSLVLATTGGDEAAHEAMGARHANLQ